ncbi:MAG: hypothetical protein ACD_23C00617G0001 [uncultured bacterium]|nr:MAG: hypothetical protein ACD_23C00617G0001 [uncultured bacterium]
MRNFTLGSGAQGVFALAFFYALSVGLLIQWVLLPVLMPGLDAGHGLLKGGDWVRFHQEAVLLAERIHHGGWAVWELRPQGNAPIGTAAAFYALTGVSKPWVLMPLNAGLFAVGAGCLYSIFACIASSRLAFIATLPYLMFPSAAMIYGQMHKDAWSIAGSLLVNLVWVRFAVSGKLSWRSLLNQVAFVLVGVWLVWVVRPYLVKVLFAASALVVLMFVVRAIFRLGGLREGHTVRWWLGIVLCLMSIVFFAKLQSGVNVLEVATPEVATPEVATPGVEGIGLVGRLAESVMAQSNNFVSGVVGARHGFATLYLHAGSNIDTGVQFDSFADMLRYVPRALQIGLFAPFPEMWGGAGVSPGADRMRLLAGFEMALAYLLLPGIVLVFMRREHSGTSAIILSQALVPIILLALVVCNVGTLYRMRYCYWQILIGLGVIGWGIGFQRWNARGRKTP